MLNKGCRVGFFGLGRSNASLLSTLPLERCEITLRSDKAISKDELPAKPAIQRILCGKEALNSINEDIIFFSPSVRRDRPELSAARERGVIFTSDAELFFNENNKPVFAVTGSDGKSTTATLINLFLNQAGIGSRLIGNIGEPLTQSLGTAECFVCELSSFMLSYLTPKAYASCITNITPNHLDWHRNFNEYKNTKLRCLEGAKRVIASDDNESVDRAFAIISAEKSYEEMRNKKDAKLYFSIENRYICRNGKKMLALSDIKLQEKHNLKNIMMAMAMTDGIAEISDILAVISSFSGLRHRCERLFCHEGVEYIDSSIDSTPARTVHTLDSIGRPVVLILGGRSKGTDYKELIPMLKKHAAFTVITGENAGEIYEAIKGHTRAEIISGFESAVLFAKSRAKDVGVLLLSPASTSYDAFKNYAERGDKFKEILLKNITNENNSLQKAEKKQ